MSTVFIYHTNHKEIFNDVKKTDNIDSLGISVYTEWLKKN